MCIRDRTTDEVEGTKELSSVNYKGLTGDVSVGDKVLLADGLVTLIIDAIEGNNIVTTVQNSGEIGNRKRVAVPGVALSLPPVSEQDEADLRFGCQQGVDFVAASFMQRGKDIVAIRRILESEKKMCIRDSLTSADVVSKTVTTIEGAAVTLDGNTDTQHMTHDDRYKKSGLTVALGGALADSVTNATRTIKQAGGRDDKRLTALEDVYKRQALEGVEFPKD